MVHNMKIKTFIKQLWQGFKVISKFISNIVNFILLSLVYFIGVGLVFIFAKIFKKKFLNLKIEKDTYWIDKKIEKQDLKDYSRMF